jgi:ankyrin repeat protein
MKMPKAPAWAALHRAAAEGDITAAEQLLLAGAAVNAADRKGRTALHKAARHGHAAVVQLLLGWQAAVNAVDKNGRTALHTARSKAVVQALLGAGAAVDAADGRTALHWVVEECHPAVVQLLLGAHAAVIAADDMGRTALQVASACGSNSGSTTRQATEACSRVSLAGYSNSSGRKAKQALKAVTNLVEVFGGLQHTVLGWYSLCVWVVVCCLLEQYSKLVVLALV